MGWPQVVLGTAHVWSEGDGWEAMKLVMKDGMQEPRTGHLCKLLLVPGVVRTTERGIPSVPSLLLPCAAGWTYDCPEPNTTGCIPNGEIVINNLSLGGYTVRMGKGGEEVGGGGSEPCESLSLVRVK